METTNFAITGLPVKHSLSPLLFKAAYPNSPSTYRLLPAANPAAALEAFHAQKLGGMNITAPFKESILSLANAVQMPEVRAIGAANLLRMQGETLYAHNTDPQGVIHALAEHGFSPARERVLILGSGGAGKAAAYALLQAGAHVYIANRTQEKARDFTRRNDGIVIRTTSLPGMMKTFKAVVNTLPPEAALLPSLSFQHTRFILDASYALHPLQEAAAKAGATYINGLYWLYYQAIPSFKLLTGQTPDKNAMREILGLPKI